MENYLIIISKQEFTSLLRFGQIPNNPNRHININNVENELFNSFLNLPFFEGDEEYIIIQVEFEIPDQKFIYTKNLTAIIPLTKAAKISLSSKFNSKIVFSDAVYESIIRKVEDQIEISDKIQGAKSLTEMFFKNKKTSIQDDILQESYLYRIKGKKSNEIQSDFFTHLVVYERYEFFPNTDLGYFYDLGEVFAHYKGKDSFKGSNYYNFLEKHKPDLREKKLSEIILFIESTNEIDSFKNLLTLDGEKLYMTAVFYLKYKGEIANKDSIKETNLSKIISWVLENNFYVNENIDALYLLGGFLGFKRLYDDYYDTIQLRIFKNKIVELNSESIDSKTVMPKKLNKIKKQTKENLIIHIGEDAVNQIVGNLSSSENQPYQSDLEQYKTTVNEAEPINENIYNGISKFNSLDEVIEKLKTLFDNHHTDELKLEKKILSDIVAILTPISMSTKITKNVICNLINTQFKDVFECPNSNTIKFKKDGGLFNSEIG